MWPCLMASRRPATTLQASIWRASWPCLPRNIKQGKKVVRLHTGDPAIYGAIREQMQWLDARQIPYEVIPGVSSAFASAAALQVELTVPEVTQTVIFTRQAGRTPVPERESLQKLAAIQASMCIFLSVSLIETVGQRPDRRWLRP